MTDANEIEALKASLRGVRRSADTLSVVLGDRVEALDPRTEIPDTDLDDLQRLSSAHAVAAQAFRGLVQTILRRRGRLQEPAADAGSAGVEE